MSSKPTPQTLARIRAAVRKTERTDLTRPQRSPESRRDGFWAKLTGGNTASGYDWARLEPQDDGTLAEPSPAMTGTNAWPSNPLADVFIDDRAVWLRFAGFDSPAGDGGLPVYVFEHPYEPPIGDEEWIHVGEETSTSPHRLVISHIGPSGTSTVYALLRNDGGTLKHTPLLIDEKGHVTAGEEEDIGDISGGVVTIPGGDDKLVKVTSADTTAGYLSDKLAIDTGSDPWLELVVDNPAGDETYLLKHIGPDTAPAIVIHAGAFDIEFDGRGHLMADADVTLPDEKVAADGSDTTPGYLDDKIDVDGTWITKSVVANQVSLTHGGPPPTTWPLFQKIWLMGDSWLVPDAGRDYLVVDTHGHVQRLGDGTATGYEIALLHNDPQAESRTRAIVQSVTTVNVSGTRKLRLTITPLSIDAKGHERASSPSNITVDLDLTSFTVVTDTRYDTTSHKLQQKTRVAYVPLADTESGWTDVHAATQETWLTNFQVDGATMKLQKKTNTAYVFEKGTESGWTDVHTGQSCSG